MAFNVGSFVKNTAKSAVQRLVHNVVGNVVSGLPSNSTLIANSTAETLFNIGSSYSSVTATSSIKTDSIISGAANDYFGMAGKDTSRTVSSTIKALRQSGNEDTQTYLNNINPTTKIAAKSESNQVTILSAV